MTFIEKPWGSETLIELNEHYCVKRLVMHLGERCSLQKHERKIETIICVSGLLRIDDGGHGSHFTVNHGGEAYEASAVNLGPGDTCTIPAGVVHRMSCTHGLEPAVYLEASAPFLDDLIRLEDDYGRA